MATEGAKKPYALVPGDNTTRWLLLGLITGDQRRRVIHLAVAWHILERCMKAHGGKSVCAVSYLQKATGFTRGSVATATEDLVAWGYFDRTMGSGKRPTEYIPNWSLVLQPQDANSVLQPWDETVLPPQDAKNRSVLPRQEESPLRKSLKSAFTIGTPSADADACLSAAPRGEGDFDALYDEFGVRRDYQKAKSEFEKTDVDIGILMPAACRWRKCYDDMGREPQFRKSLAVWLRDQCWREDGPARLPLKKKIEATAKRQADNDNEVDDVKVTQMIPDPPRRVGRWTGTITAASVEQAGGDTAILIEMAGGKTRRVLVEAADERTQARGQRELAHLSGIAGADIEDASQLNGLAVSLVEFDDGGAEWKAA